MIDYFYITDLFKYPPDEYVKYAEEMISLYEDADWWNDEVDTSATLARIITGSHIFMVARDSRTKEIIGLGRIISDRVTDAYVQDITVRKDYRGQGIAKEILKRLVEKAKLAGLPRLLLIAERGTANLYKHVGFEVCETDVSMELNL